MMLDMISGYDFSEEEVKFVDLLAFKADGNKLVPISDLDELKRQLEKEGISADKLERLCKKMQDNCILECHDGMGESMITLNSDQVVIFQTHLKNISCPKCRKRPLQKKTITYCPCPDCDYETDG